MSTGPKNNIDFIAVLENVRSLHNVGSIFRTADGAGVKEVILCGIHYRLPAAQRNPQSRPRRRRSRVLALRKICANGN
jgi:hypothetical protein